MKLLLGFLGLLALTAVGLPLLVAAVVATHPWLAVGMFTGSVQVRDDRPAPVKAGLPASQWPNLIDAAQQSTCHISAEDLAAIVLMSPTDSPPKTASTPSAMASTPFAISSSLCALGYGVDRMRALTLYGQSADFASQINKTAATLAKTRDVVQVAERWLGVPYVFGGCSTSGIDCSCLVQRVFQAIGVNLPRTAAEQYAATTRIPREQLQPGDLVFFANTYMPGVSHVGIYIGAGQQINAPTEGQKVSIQPVFDGYWGAHYFGGGRVLPL